MTHRSHEKCIHTKRFRACLEVKLEMKETSEQLEMKETPEQLEMEETSEQLSSIMQKNIRAAVIDNAKTNIRTTTTIFSIFDVTV